MAHGRLHWLLLACSLGDAKWLRDMKVAQRERPFMLSSPLAVAQSCVLMAIHNTDEETRHTDTATITFPDSQPMLTVTDVEHIPGWL